MEHTYIAIYDQSIKKHYYTDLKARLADGAIARISGSLGRNIITCYEFAYEKPGDECGVFRITGDEARTLVQLACPPSRLFVRSDEFVQSIDYLADAVVDISLLKDKIGDGHYALIFHAEELRERFDFEFPSAPRRLLHQLNHRLLDAEAMLRRFLQERLDSHSIADG
jgi:hypothetical protein